MLSKGITIIIQIWLNMMPINTAEIDNTDILTEYFMFYQHTNTLDIINQYTLTTATHKQSGNPFSQSQCSWNSLAQSQAFSQLLMPSLTTANHKHPSNAASQSPAPTLPLYMECGDVMKGGMFS